MASHRPGQEKKSLSSSLKTAPVHLPPPPSPSCPFCGIASAYPPVRPTSSAAAARALQRDANADANAEARPRAHLILSTKHVLAFLDIMPLTKGHVLLVTRGHWEKLGDVGVEVGKEVSKKLHVEHICAVYIVQYDFSRKDALPCFALLLNAK